MQLVSTFSYVEPAEIEMLKTERYAWVILQERLGPANPAGGETAIPLRPPPPLAGVSMRTTRGLSAK